MDDVVSSLRAAHATTPKVQHSSVHIPDFTEKLKRPEKSSTIDVISTMTRDTQRRGTGFKNGEKNIDVAQTNKLCKEREHEEHAGHKQRCRLLTPAC